MRPAAFKKLVGAAFVLAVLAIVSAPLALAQSSPCEDACIRQWDADKAQCDADLRACYADCDAQTQACQQDPANQDPISQALCIRDGNICHYACARDWRRCTAGANTTAYNCFRDCQTSPSN